MYRAIPGGVFSFFVRDDDSHHKAFAVYGPMGGAFVGCVLVLSGFELWYQGSSTLPVLLSAWILVVQAVGLPICAYIVACIAIGHYRSQGAAQKMRPMLIKTLAAFIVLVAVRGLLEWYAS